MGPHKYQRLEDSKRGTDVAKTMEYPRGSTECPVHRKHKSVFMREIRKTVI